jgi:hypothetical protein
MAKSVNCLNTSGFAGVSFDKRRGAWMAYVYRNKKNTFIGRDYATSDEANQAREKYLNDDKIIIPTVRSIFSSSWNR